MQLSLKKSRHCAAAQYGPDLRRCRSLPPGEPMNMPAAIVADQGTTRAHPPAISRESCFLCPPRSQSAPGRPRLGVVGATRALPPRAAVRCGAPVAARERAGPGRSRELTRPGRSRHVGATRSSFRLPGRRARAAGRPAGSLDAPSRDAWRGSWPLPNTLAESHHSRYRYRPLWPR
jgi:hypothetical protein